MLGLLGTMFGGATTAMSDKLHEAKMRELGEEKKEQQLQLAREGARAEFLTGVKNNVNKVQF